MHLKYLRRHWDSTRTYILINLRKVGTKVGQKSKLRTQLSSFPTAFLNDIKVIAFTSADVSNVVSIIKRVSSADLSLTITYYYVQIMLQNMEGNN